MRCMPYKRYYRSHRCLEVSPKIIINATIVTQSSTRWSHPPHSAHPISSLGSIGSVRSPLTGFGWAVKPTKGQYWVTYIIFYWHYSHWLSNGSPTWNADSISIVKFTRTYLVWLAMIGDLPRARHRCGVARGSCGRVCDHSEDRVSQYDSQLVHWVHSVRWLSQWSRLCLIVSGYGDSGDSVLTVAAIVCNRLHKMWGL